MTYKNYPIYLKTGRFSKQVIGNAKVHIKVERHNYDYDDIETTYLGFSFFPFFHNIILKQFVEKYGKDKALKRRNVK